MIDVRAFVVPPGTKERVYSLNQAVCDCAVLPVQGVAGTGKDRFIDWWHLNGAQSERLPESFRVAPDDIVQIALEPSPASAIPMICVAFSMLWFALRVLDSRMRGVSIEYSTHRQRSFSTEQQFLSLYHDSIVPIIWKLQPRAIVVSNAHLLDERTLHWLLHLRMFAYDDRPRIARHALILIAKITDYDAGKFADLMNKSDETKVVWPNRLDFRPLNDGDFQQMIVGICAQNLKALFAPDIDQGAALDRFAQWTGKNWWLITEFVKLLDQMLGPSLSSGEPRRITQTVVEAVERQWIQRTQ
jgi:hypothetical protein